MLTHTLTSTGAVPSKVWDKYIKKVKLVDVFIININNEQWALIKDQVISVFLIATPYISESDSDQWSLIKDSHL